MTTSTYHIAQINIARMLAPLDDPIMAEFVASLSEINALADRSPGFFWRFQTEEGDATGIRPYDDDRIIVNFSVWETIEDLKAYVYQSAHAEVMRRRRQWFEKFEGVYMALWWVEAGHIPTVAEAMERLEYLSTHGVSESAFTFKQPFGPPDQAGEDLVVVTFDPCPAI
jgi:heme-degrading monooxygenase HmoA